MISAGAAAVTPGKQAKAVNVKKMLNLKAVTKAPNPFSRATASACVVTNRLRVAFREGFCHNREIAVPVKPVT